MSLRPSTHDHKNLKARDKNSLVGAPPYGFARLRGKLVVVPKEIETVRLVMNLWQQHMTFRAIAKHLNSLGLRTRKCGKWEHSVIKSIINRHKDNPNRIEEIITWASKN